MPITIMYHNPRCSKSRQALQLLKEHKTDLKVINYLENPPTVQELTKILKLLNLTPRQLMRTKETVYQENKLADEGLTDQELISMMVKYPILIERPIVIHEQRAVIGRPPENVLEIIK